MKTPLYRNALRHSWKLAWHHKEMWVFGLFAALLGQMGLVEILSKITFTNEKFAAGELTTMEQAGAVLRGLQGLPWQADTMLAFVWLLFMLFGLVIFGVFVSVVSQGAIIHAAAASTKRVKKFPSTSKAWHAGVDHFWKLLSVNVIKKLVLWAVAVIISLATVNVMVVGGTADMVIFLLLFVFAVLVGIVVSFLIVYAAAYIVVEEMDTWESIKAAWKLFKDHWLVSIEVGIVLLIFNLLLVLIVLAGLFTLFLHAALVAAVSLSTGAFGLFNIGLFAEFLVFAAFVLFVASLYTVFATSTWTYLFMKMHKKGVKSRIVHFFSKK